MVTLCQELTDAQLARIVAAREDALERRARREAAEAEAMAAHADEQEVAYMLHADVESDGAPPDELAAVVGIAAAASGPALLL